MADDIDLSLRYCPDGCCANFTDLLGQDCYASIYGARHGETVGVAIDVGVRDARGEKRPLLSLAQTAELMVLTRDVRDAALARNAEQLKGS